jgi:AraC family transcriptional regulator
MQSKNPKLSVNLEPEQHLIASLPPKWQQRFRIALDAMNAMLEHGDNVTWEEIVQQADVSAHHFHRMFSLVFNETPGQYINRQRLQWAVSLIMLEPELTVTDIAQDAGFSSSQALAKALKRTLGMSAKQIKQQHSQPGVFPKLMLALGQPCKNDALSANLQEMTAEGLPQSQSPQRSVHSSIEAQSLEQKIAAAMTFSIQTMPARPLVIRSLQTSSMVEMFKVWLEMKPKGGEHAMVNLMRINYQDEFQSVDGFEVGYLSESRHQANGCLPAGRYLSAKVTVSSITAYFAAWDALFSYLLKHDLLVDESCKCIEIIDTADDIWALNTEMLLSLKLKD